MDVCSLSFCIGQQRLPVSQNTLLTSEVDLSISGIARYARSRRNLGTSFLLKDSIGVLLRPTMAPNCGAYSYKIHGLSSKMKTTVKIYLRQKVGNQKYMSFVLNIQKC